MKKFLTKCLILFQISSVELYMGKFDKSDANTERATGQNSGPNN